MTNNSGFVKYEPKLFVSVHSQVERDTQDFREKSGAPSGYLQYPTYKIPIRRHCVASLSFENLFDRK